MPDPKKEEKAKPPKKSFQTIAGEITGVTIVAIAFFAVIGMLFPMVIDFIGELLANIGNSLANGFVRGMTLLTRGVDKGMGSVRGFIEVVLHIAIGAALLFGVAKLAMELFKKPSAKKEDAQPPAKADDAAHH